MSWEYRKVIKECAECPHSRIMIKPSLNRYILACIKIKGKPKVADNAILVDCPYNNNYVLKLNKE